MIEIDSTVFSPQKEASSEKYNTIEKALVIWQMTGTPGRSVSCPVKIFSWNCVKEH